jgi:Glycosyltransferases involved in cell wall biogenesis
MDGFVSIIMPVYQALEWLENSVNSILNQSYTNYELLLIENGSNDGSEILCDKFAKKYPQIYCIHQKLKGVSRARNVGLEYARGDYIVFVDCDDTLDVKTLDTVVNIIKSTNVDIVIYNFCRCYPSGDVENVIVDLEDGIYKNRDFVNIFMKLFDSNIANNIGTKLYKRDIIGDLKFDEDINVFEDIGFCMKVLRKADSLFFLNQNLYHYEIKNSNSLYSIFKKDYYKSFCDFFQELYSWGSGIECFDDWFYIKFMYGIKGALRNAKMGKKSFKREFKKIISNPTIELAKCNIKKNKFRGNNLKTKIIFYMIWHKCYWGIKFLWK